MKLKKILISKGDFLTKKYIFENGGKTIEAVYVDRVNKNIICMSCMFGCPVKCKFCASGETYFGKLNSHEMNEIIFEIVSKESLNQEKKLLISFMGTGEPCLNLDSIIKTIEFISQKYPKSYFAISISGTASKKLEKLNNVKNKNVKIQFSLHSPYDDERKNLIPLTDNIGNIFAILSTLNFDIEINYLLLNNINDSETHAIELCNLVRGTNYSLKINEYHAVGKGFIESMNKQNFISILKKERICFETYATDGVDIGAACGQLKSKILK